MHKNTREIMRLEAEAIEQGWNQKHRGECFCEEVAKAAGEVGNDYPSDNALEIARKLLASLGE